MSPIEPQCALVQPTYFFLLVQRQTLQLKATEELTEGKKVTGNWSFRPSIDTKICDSLNKRQPKLAVKDLFTVSQAFNPRDNLIIACE